MIMREYRKLNLNSLNYSDTTMTYDEAIKNSTPYMMIDIELDGEEIPVSDERIVCLNS